MILPSAVLLLLALLTQRSDATSNCSYVCSEQDYVQHYFAACLASPACQANLNLFDNERAYFDHLLHTELLWPKQMDWTVICQAGAYDYVFADLCTHEFCRPNYIMDVDRGCICRGDRECDEASPSHFRLSELAKAVLILVLVVLVIYIGLAMLKDLRKALKLPSHKQKLSSDATKRNYDGLLLEVE
jgi:hypothetical protein